MLGKTLWKLFMTYLEREFLLVSSGDGLFGASFEEIDWFTDLSGDSPPELDAGDGDRGFFPFCTDGCASEISVWFSSQLFGEEGDLSSSVGLAMLGVSNKNLITLADVL